MRCSIIVERKMLEKQGGRVRKWVALIKSLIYGRKKRSARGAFVKD